MTAERSTKKGKQKTATGKQAGIHSIFISFICTENLMELIIPFTLKKEHDDLHKVLYNASLLAGQTGADARKAAALLHPHFVKEEKLALPLLGLLPAISDGSICGDLQPAIALSDELKQQLPQLLNEHEQIIGALKKLIKTALEEKHCRVAQFAEKLIDHARSEEEIIYPSALLIGEYLKLKQSSVY